MPICITCSTPVKHLYTTYSKADDRALGKGVRLTQCPNCKRFADKYVEHDYVVLFIDLVLIKPQVYRHLLFNRLGRTDDKLNPSILRLGILLILFDVYITWARIERSNDPGSLSAALLSPNTDHGNGNERLLSFSRAPIITQYLFFLTLNVAATLAQHVTIRLLVRRFIGLFVTGRGVYGRDRTSGGVEAGGGPVKLGAGQGQGQGQGQAPSRPPSRGDGVRSQRQQPIRSPSGGVNQNTDTSTATTEGRMANQPPVIHDTTSSPQTTTTTTTSQLQPHVFSSPISPSSPSPSPSPSTRDLNSLTSKPTTASTSKTTTTTSYAQTYASPSAISTALLVSSCTKLFPILLVIWPTTPSDRSINPTNPTSIFNPNPDQSLPLTSTSTAPNSTLDSLSTTATSFAHRASSYIGWIVLLNNMEALQILLGCGYVFAGAVAVAGVVARWLVEGWLLGAVGLVRDGGGFGDGPVADVLGLWAWWVGRS